MRHGVRPLAAAALIGLLAALATTGCGGSSSTGSAPSPASSSAVVGPPTSPSGPLAGDVPGYAIAPASESARSTFEGLVTGSQGAFKGLSAYTVTKGGEDVGGLVLFDVDPAVVVRPEAAEDLTTALVKTLSGESTVTTRMFGGLRVVSATSGGTTFTAWFNGDVISVVIGPDADRIHAFVDASIAA